MWKFIFLVGILIVINYSFAAPSSNETTELLNNKEDELLASSSSSSSTESSPSSSSSSASTIEQILEITSPQPLSSESTTKRRQITYDQRQDGQYNIRADLENFMIVVIPPNPVAGVNLLDLITRSSLKRSNIKKITKKHQNVQKSSRPSISKFNNQNLYEFVNRMQQQSIIPIGGQQTKKNSEFIEGRTPYKVDITASSLPESDTTKLHSSETQVDVIPPSYPFHLHLMKPYHLEAEPTTVIQSSYHHPQYQPSFMTQGKLFDYLNGFNNGDIRSNGPIGINRRNSKSIKYPLDLKELITNMISINNDEHNSQKRNIDNDTFDNYYDYNEYNIDDNDSHHYSVLDVFNKNEIDEFRNKIPAFNEILMNNGDNIKSIGSTEECGPDGIRDSYGICHYFPELFSI